MNSLHHRLRLGVLLIVGALLAVAGIVATPLLHAFLKDQFDRSLLSRARQLTAAPTAGDRFLNRFFEDPPPEFRPGPEAEFLELQGLDGRVIARSPSLGTFALNLRKSGASGADFFNVKLPGGRRGRAVALRVRLPETADKALSGEIVAVLAQDVRILQRSQDLALGIVVAIGVALFGLSIWLVNAVTRRGLHPVNRLAEQVGGIHEQALDARISADGMPDELRPIVEQLNRMMGRLQTAFQREQRFSASAAHELLTPVSELRAAAENALQLRGDPEATDELAADTLDAAVRMERTVRTLLALSRDRKGDLATDEPVDLARMVAETLERLKDRIERKGLEVRVVAPEPSMARGAKSALESIVCNLLENAVEYTPYSGWIDCRIERAGDCVRLVIANRNPGLEPEALSRLWEPFWRRDSARSDSAHAGLGLSLVRALAENIGASVSASIPSPDRFEVAVELREYEPAANELALPAAVDGDC